MRILHISSAKTYGGGERHLVDLTRGLAARGHEIFVALRPTNEWEERLDFLPPENIFHASIRNSFGVFSAQRIAKFVGERRIEIVHAHAARDYIPASLVCRVAKETKFVLTRHVLFPMKPFHRFALSNLARAIAVSSSVEKNLTSIFPPRRIELIPNGIDPGNFDARVKSKQREEFRFLHNIPFDAQLIGTVGEIKELKGQRDFVLAANEIAARRPDTFFLIVGRDYSYNQQFRRELKRLVRVFGLEERFLFLDWVEDLPAALAAFDVFVSASHTESFGLAILEAMASETAIVATATEGAQELLRDGETASLVPLKDPVALAKALEALLSDPAKMEKFAARARLDAENKFSLQEMIEKTESLYRQILRND
jgi:L-malate glycosyltransferase